MRNSACSRIWCRVSGLTQAIYQLVGKFVNKFATYCKFRQTTQNRQPAGAASVATPGEISAVGRVNLGCDQWGPRLALISERQPAGRHPESPRVEPDELERDPLLA